VSLSSPPAGLGQLEFHRIGRGDLVKTSEDHEREQHRLTYCLVPYELRAQLHELLRRHFGRDPSIEVIVERRQRDRRKPGDRRGRVDAPPADDRRRIVGTAGRRIAERRAALIPVEPPLLPPGAERYRDRLTFVERLEPSTQALEDADSTRLVVRVQAGDREAFGLLYMRYFDRVYSYLRLALSDANEAEDATQHVFVRVLESLPRYQPEKPFRAWLFTIARNGAIDELRRRGRLHTEEPEEVERRRERAAGPAETELWALKWVSDRDLLHLVDRLPLAQRQVLFFRYALDLPASEVGDILGRSPEDVRQLHSRGLRFLRQRLTALGRPPSRREEGREMRRLRRRSANAR
jgi:RNA polymerase sigma-70 factor (ECF subfamily)